MPRLQALQHQDYFRRQTRKIISVPSTSPASKVPGFSFSSSATACSHSPSEGKYLWYDDLGPVLKFTIFGLTISSSWGNGHATPYRAILRALNRMGHQVVFYEKDVPYYA